MPRGPVRSLEQLQNELAQLMRTRKVSSLTKAEYTALAKGAGLASTSTYLAKFGSWEAAVQAAASLNGQTPPAPPVSENPAPEEKAPAPEAKNDAPAPPAKQSSPSGAITWKETPKEERERQLAAARAEAERSGTLREARLVNLFGAKVIFGREVTSASTKSLDPEGEARICSSELKPIRDGVEDSHGLTRLVGGTLLRRQATVAMVLKAGHLEAFPPEKPHTFYLVPKTVADILLATGRKDLIYPCSYGSGSDGTIVCREIVIP